MAHLRNRYAGNLLKRALSHSPIVGVLGQRQVGKTTLIEAHSSNYLTLDREANLLEAESNPELFVQNRKPSPFAIDEAQLCPRLFPVLKEAVRLHKRPGQFLLSGSVRFTSRKIIRESLTGRIVTVELLPFSIAEAHSQPLPNVILSVLSGKFHPEGLFKASHFENYLLTGGLPGVCFFRQPSVRAEKFESHLDTLLNRDLRLVSKTTLSYPLIRLLLVHLAKNQGRAFDLKSAADNSQISTVSIKKLLVAFEALFLIRAVSSSGPEKKWTYFLEDQGMATWLIGSIPGDDYDICRGLYSCLRQEIVYRPELNGRITQYRTKHGVNVPIVFTTTKGILGIIPTVQTHPAPKTIASALAFLKRWPRSRVLIATSGGQFDRRSKSLYYIPFHYLLS